MQRYVVASDSPVRCEVCGREVPAGERYAWCGVPDFTGRPSWLGAACCPACARIDVQREKDFELHFRAPENPFFRGGWWKR